MNILSSSVTGSTSSKILPISLAMASLLLSACSTAPKGKNPEMTWDNSPTLDTGWERKMDMLIKNMLQKNGEEIAELIAQKIETDPSFHSLDAIKAFIGEELKKRGINSFIISAQLLPFMPTSDGQYKYLSVHVITGTPRGGIDFALETSDKEKAAPVLMNMVDNFEKQTAKKVLEGFVAGIAENGGTMEVTALEKKIISLLETEKHLFLQHGFELQWVKIGQDNETGEVNVYLEIYNIPTNEIMHMPVPTGIMEEKPKKRKGGGNSGETMLASAE